MPNRGQYDYKWQKLRLRVLSEENRTCYRCGRFADSVDHLVPLCERPDLRLERSNLRACCRACNSGRVSRRLQRVRELSRRPAPVRQW
jgi:5-methylcytosine-specific restriction endonuclease McrA